LKEAVTASITRFAIEGLTDLQARRGETSHTTGAKYMPLYVAKFRFRYNNRFNSNIFGTAISGC